MATHRRVLQWLENELFDGNLVLGQQLPSDRDLASVLGVHRGTMREALKILEAQGVLRLYEGSRKTILPMLVREPAASAGPALQLHMATADYPLRDIVQTRVLLETWALTNADNRSPAMGELRTLLREMGRDDISLKEFHHLYVSFHIALVKSSDNTLVAALMSALRDSIYEYTMALVGHVPLWSKTVDRIRAEHQAIFSAVLAGDNTLAARLVEEHIEYQYVEAGVDPERGPREEPAEATGPMTGPVASGRVWSHGNDDAVPATAEHTPVKEAVAMQVARNSGHSVDSADDPEAVDGDASGDDDVPESFGPEGHERRTG
ncbi:FadR family transcriptional regulator [Kocuria sp. JC486]|uniref:FadR family transcriptional regulator n=1 Tax=Kocuria soli TaxID=2485125 RepID=A0A3N3ZTF0_9MICC|nr:MULTISPECIES: FCD domain-containing protein [Kocuria]NHU84651.1 FadR family transcriptional regulator [Kocuria sp. JC486]ROZ65578.1 FadR family transcriptional regulator [Kocuria soli]